MALKTILPQRVYAGLFGVAIEIYRKLLRALYLRRVVYYWLKGDQPNYEKARTVYRVMPYSLVGSSGLELTYEAAEKLMNEEGNPGAFVECGVAEGGSSALMAMVAGKFGSEQKTWLFDSFEGLPSPTDQDFDQPGGSTRAYVKPLGKGSCLGTKEAVENLLFRKFGLDSRNIHLVKGWFQDTLPVMSERIGPIALLRIDADWFESINCCLENLYNQVVQNGYIIFDDYGLCVGAKKATDEFLARRGLLVALSFDGRGGAFFRKPPGGG